MINSTALDKAQIQQYHEDGYIFLGKIFSDETVEALRKEEYRFRTSPIWPDSSGLATTIFRSQVQAYSSVVRRAGLEGGHVPSIQQLIGPNVIFWYTQFVTKLPDANTGKSEFPWHQDNGYARGILPATNITVWVALDAVDERNGCVYVLPGSHKHGLLDHSTKADTWHLQIDVEGDGVPAILQPGEAVAFTGLTLHRSKLNHTVNARRGFFMEYADADAREGVTTDHPRYLVDLPWAYFISGEASLSRLQKPPTAE